MEFMCLGKEKDEVPVTGMSPVADAFICCFTSMAVDVCSNISNSKKREKIENCKSQYLC